MYKNFFYVMKLDHVILASNDNPDYLNFWPLVSEAWTQMGVDPILIYTGKSKNNLQGNVFHYDSKNLNSAFVAQNIRILYPALLNNKNCIVSDIDLLPLSKKYFLDSIENIPNNSFIIYRPDSGVPENMISMMWNAANSSTWKEIFNIESEKEIHKKLKKWYSRKYSLRGKAWYTDQIQLRRNLDNFSIKNPERVIKLNDTINGFNRFNRTKLEEHFEAMNKKDVIFSDFHMPRPYEEYEELILEVYNSQKKYLSE